MRGEILAAILEWERRLVYESQQSADQAANHLMARIYECVAADQLAGDEASELILRAGEYLKTGDRERLDKALTVVPE